jgi:hypothetical protein
MPRVNLSVHFADKDKAKALGAKWDAASKVWFVPDGIDPAPFKHWLPLPDATAPNVRCNKFYIVTANQNCWKCSIPVFMTAFVLPSGWEEWQEAEDDREEHWEKQEVDAMLNYIGYLNDNALIAVQKINPDYKPILQPGHKSKKYINHCQKCGVPQREPNSGNTHVFKPDLVEQAEQLTAHLYNQPFESQTSFVSGLRCHGGFNALEYMKHGFAQK